MNSGVIYPRILSTVIFRVILILEIYGKVCGYEAEVDLVSYYLNSDNLCENCNITLDFYFSQQVVNFPEILNGQGPNSTHAQTKCKSGWVEYGSSCYKFVSEFKSYAEAENHCAEIDSELISINDEKEAKFISEYPVEHPNKFAGTFGRLWIGLKRYGADWSWADVTSKFFDWREGESSAPKDECAEFMHGERKLNTHKCTAGWQSVCEKRFRNKDAKTSEKNVVRVFKSSAPAKGSKDKIFESQLPDCKCSSKAADIIIVLDGSHSIKSHNFNTSKKFIINLLTKLHEENPKKLRVGMVTFTDKVRQTFKLSKYRNPKKFPAMIREIEKLKYHSGGTKMEKALDHVRKRMLGPKNGQRKNTPNIIIILSDGHSFDEPVKPALALRNKGSSIIPIGIGPQIKNETFRKQLQEVAGSKDLLTVEKFKELNSLIDDVIGKQCAKVCPVGPGPPPPSVAPQCECTPGGLDIIFVLDSSSSVKEANFNKSKLFTINLIRKFIENDAKMRFGLITFTEKVDLAFKLSKYTDKSRVEEMISEVANLEYNSGGTFLQTALQFVIDNMISESNGDRSDAPNLIIVLSDGHSFDNPVLPANILRRSGAKILPIGVGPQVQNETFRAELKAVGGTEKLHAVEQFDELNSLIDGIVNEQCQDVCPRNSSANQGSNQSSSKIGRINLRLYNGRSLNLTQNTGFKFKLKHIPQNPRFWVKVKMPDFKDFVSFTKTPSDVIDPYKLISTSKTYAENKAVCISTRKCVQKQMLDLQLKVRSFCLDKSCRNLHEGHETSKYDQCFKIAPTESEC